MAGMTDLRVVDLSDQVSGAYACRLLATAGAQVTLVEPTTGSPIRSRPPLLTASDPMRSAAFEYLSSWKRGVALDWSSEAGFEALGRLLDRLMWWSRQWRHQRLWILIGEFAPSGRR